MKTKEQLTAEVIAAATEVCALWDAGVEAAGGAQSYFIENVKRRARLKTALDELNATPQDFGCHLDLFDTVHQTPTGCVIDAGDYEDCLYAPQFKSDKTQCPYWAPVSADTSAVEAAARIKLSEREG